MELIAWGKKLCHIHCKLVIFVLNIFQNTVPESIYAKETQRELSSLPLPTRAEQHLALSSVDSNGDQFVIPELHTLAIKMSSLKKSAY